MSRLLVAIAAVMLGATGASAQAVYVERDDGAVYAAPPADADAAIVERETVGPRVYGWSAEGPLRPESCGTFKYWNGAYCADARDEPSRE